MKLITTLISAAALALIATAPTQADDSAVNKANNITCIPDRMARCKKDGTCEWKTASERDKAQILTLDFNAKKAFFSYKGKNRGGGYIFDDKMENAARTFVISKDESRKPRTTMEMSVDKMGKLTGTRNAGKIKFEATCKVS